MYVCITGLPLETRAIRKAIETVDSIMTLPEYPDQYKEFKVSLTNMLEALAEVPADKPENVVEAVEEVK